MIAVPAFICVKSAKCMLTSNVSPAVTSNAISSLRISSPAGMVLEVLPANVMGVGVYTELLDASDNRPRESSECDEGCAVLVSLAEGFMLFVNCADFAIYASLMVTGSVPVRFEKWNRSLFPEKHARIG